MSNTQTIDPIADMQHAMESLRASAHRWEDKFADLLTRHPLDSLVGIMLGASWLFYVAERHVNPKIKTLWDAVYYITTCASVGYADIFAKTNAGKAISSFVMTFGPALTAQALEKRGVPREAANLDMVVSRLDAILAELQQQRAIGGDARRRIPM